MNRPCGHPDEQLPAPGGRYFSNQCHVCWLWVNNPGYKARIEAQTEKPKLIPVNRPLNKPKGCGCGK